MYHGDGSRDLASSRMTWYLEDSVYQSHLTPVGRRVQRDKMYDSYSSKPIVYQPPRANSSLRLSPLPTRDETLIARLNVLREKTNKLDQLLQPKSPENNQQYNILTPNMIMLLINGSTILLGYYLL